MFFWGYSKEHDECSAYLQEDDSAVGEIIHRQFQHSTVHSEMNQTSVVGVIENQQFVQSVVLKKTFQRADV